MNVVDSIGIIKTRVGRVGDLGEESIPQEFGDKVPGGISVSPLGCHPHLADVEAVEYTEPPLEGVALSAVVQVHGMVGIPPEASRQAADLGVVITREPSEHCRLAKAQALPDGKVRSNAFLEVGG
jgi:hypothetical protein